jgi:hypothetical protein
MHCEKASGPFDAELLAEDDALVDDPTFATPGLPELLPPPQAAASRARPAVAMMAAVVRAVAGHARRGRRMTWVRSFIVPVSALRWWLRLVVERQAGLASFGFIGCSVRGGPRRRGLAGLATGP